MYWTTSLHNLSKLIAFFHSLQFGIFFSTRSRLPWRIKAKSTRISLFLMHRKKVLTLGHKHIQIFNVFPLGSIVRDMGYVVVLHSLERRFADGHLNEGIFCFFIIPIQQMSDNGRQWSEEVVLYALVVQLYKQCFQTKLCLKKISWCNDSWWKKYTRLNKIADLD